MSLFFEGDASCRFCGWVWPHSLRCPLGDPLDRLQAIANWERGHRDRMNGRSLSPTFSRQETAHYLMGYDRAQQALVSREVDHDAS